MQRLLAKLPLPRRAEVRIVADDLHRSSGMWRLWFALGWRDIEARYRRTVLGPFWTVLSIGVLVFSLGGVYSILWNVDTSVFLPYFAAGFLSWTFMLTCVTESCSVLINAQSVIKTMRLPYFVHIWQLLWRNVIVFFHGLLIHVLVLIVMLKAPTIYTPLFLLGMVAALANFFWMSLLLGVICARFRDITQIITSIMQVMFFVTPIFWQPDRISGRPEVEMLLVHMNPIFHIVDVIRSPLLGEMPRLESYIYLGVMCVVGWSVALLFTSRFYKRISYWL